MKCWLCNGTGKIEKPLDEEKFNQAFDRYDNMGHFISMGEARKKALEDVGYTWVDCPECKKTAE